MCRTRALIVLIGCLAAALPAFEVLAQNQGSTLGAREATGGMTGGGGGVRFADINLLVLLLNDKVQNDLQLDEDQKTKAKEAYAAMMNAEQENFSALQNLSGEERRTKMRDLRKQNKDKLAKYLGEILSPRQLERFKQIKLQEDGAMALFNSDVVKALNITSEQQVKMKSLLDQYKDKMSGSMSSMPNESRESFHAKMAKMQENLRKTIKQLNEKLLGILTQDQRDQFEKMQGAKIDVDISALRGPGGRGPQVGPGGGGN